MSALFEQGFFVREPAWHGLGVVLPDYPTREEAMALAGHDWDVLERPVYNMKRANPDDGGKLVSYTDEKGETSYFRPSRIKGFTDHYRSDTGETLSVRPESFERIPNSTAYEIADILFDEGFVYETGITLDGGRLCALTLKLNEPFTVPGDDSIILPFGNLSWRHDGMGALKARTGTVRQVCANTVTASEMEGERLGTSFTFRHTKNVKERIEDAKLAMKGLRRDIDVYKELAEELGRMHVTPAQRDLFVSAIVGDKDYSVSKGVDVSERVLGNIERERHKVFDLFMQGTDTTTIPEAHVLTGYGLFLSGVEYFDHLRPYRSQESYVKRTLLNDNPAKASLVKTIREIVAA